jgi:pimeloyl-ACP methyl ester carboxylesterase
MRKYLKWVLTGIVALLVIIAVYPFIVSDMETIELNDAVRASMPNESFVKLSDGYTHYEWAGPENGQPVVLVHGAGTPMFMWDYQFKTLADAGFRVLRYDLFGRGLSDRPVYTADLFDRQLLELLDSQNIRKPVDIVGQSAGGAITIRFIDRHPEWVRRFTLFSPAGFPTHFPLINRIMCWPFVGEWTLRAIGNRAIVSKTAQGVENPDRIPEYMQKFPEQMKYKGFKRSLLAMMRDGSFFDLKTAYERVGKSGKQGILFMGTKDSIIPFEHHLLIQAAIPSIEFHAIDGKGHDLVYSWPETVNPQLIEFLKR